MELPLAGPDHCEKLAAARERMAASLALTPGMWLQWIEDGIALAASPQDLTRVEALFECAAADCPSPDVYAAWATFLDRPIDGGDCDAAAIARVRAVHEKALGSMGLNVVAGGKLWDAAIAFEHQLLANANLAIVAAAVESRSKISSFVKRRFSLPLEGMQAVALALHAPLPPYIQPAYNIALSLLAARTRHESQVATGNWEAWSTYAAWEASQGQPSRAHDLHVVYERRHAALRL